MQNNKTRLAKTSKRLASTRVHVPGMTGSWTSHTDMVRPAIKALDRQQARSVAAAPGIPVTNK